MRQLARALTGFRNDWTDSGPDALPLRQASSTTRAPSRSTAGAASTPGRRACGWSRATAATPSSWSRSCGATSSRPSRRAATAKQLAKLYVQRDREVRPLLEAILAHPDLYDPGKRMVKPPVVQVRGHAARRRARDRHARLGVAVRERRPVPVPAAERLRLGRHALAGHGDVPRALADGPAHLRTRPGSTPRPATDVPPTPPSWSAAPPRSGARRALSGPVRAGLERYAADTLATADQALEEGELPRAGAERAADARRHLPRLPDELTAQDCCTEHARASAGLPAIEAGMPEPAGTGLSRRSFLLRSAGLGLAVYGAGKLAQLPAFETGVAHAQARRAEHRAAERVPGRRRRLAVPARPGRRPELPPAAPEARRCATAARSPRTRGCAGTRRRTRWPTCTPRARSPSCPRSATPTPTSRTSRRATSGRSARSTPNLRTGWLGRVLDRVGSPDNPLQGVSLDGQLAPVAGDRAQPGGGDRQARGLRLLDARRVGPGRGARRARVHAASGARCTARSDPAIAQAARAAAFAGGVRDALAPLGVDGKPPYTPAAAYPQTAEAVPEAARRLRGDARRRACRSAPPRSARPAPTTRTPTRRSRCRKNLKLTFDSLLAFQRDLEARGLADRVLTLVWSEFGRRAAGERLGHRPRRRRRRLPRRHARRRAG